MIDMKKDRIFWLLVVCLLVVLAGCGKEKGLELPMKMNTPRNIRGVHSYKACFGDLNDLHLSSAKVIGITPVGCREDADRAMGKVFNVFTNSCYKVDSLTHSIPYLVPKACVLLYKIGHNFKDSLASKGLNPYRPVVTSILRTKDDVKRLRRRNGNASLNSAHFYGTTFDVSYKRFDKMEDESGCPLQDVSETVLKNVLAEVLRDLKKGDECYVKYELKQGCFHITAR